VVNGLTYVVDCGNGVGRQLALAGCRLPSLHDVFVTHLHSDHDADFFTLFLLGWKWIQEGVRSRGTPIGAWGPGPAGGLASLPQGRSGSETPIVNAANPAPGLNDVTRAQVEAHAYDINIRMRDTGHTDLTTLFVPHEIAIPAGVGAYGPDRVAPPMDPVLVKEDDNVRVTAILVEHPPVFPSFAFRFDTDDGSIVVSGDTRPTPNLVTLAQGADILVHEVMDPGVTARLQETAPRWRDQTGWAASDRHMMAAHTSLDEVGKVAAEASVKKLVLSHFIPSFGVSDDRWLEGASAGFDGEVIVGRDLLEIAL
jgi:ribonuclease BN (tRNA processing enzyme)